MNTRMKDIAKDLNLSVMTISKALRNHSDVSAETRKRVLQRASELNYEPNLVARSLITRRTYMVGLVIPDLMHSFFAEVAAGIARRLEPLSYQILIADTGEDAERELKHIRLLLTRKVDGLIVASAQVGKPKLKSMFADFKTPYVLIDRKIAGLEANYVGVKDEDISALAVDHLISQGCLRIAHIQGPDVATGVGRRRGYRRALAKHGLQPIAEYIVRGESSDETGYRAMKQILSLPRRPDGVFCYNDPVAVGAMKAALESGVDVPNELAIVGVGNVHYSDLLRVPLSTIDQSSVLIGENAADLLIACMSPGEIPERREILIPPKLIVRKSSTRVNSAGLDRV